MRKPFFQDKMTTLYLGDCREILPELEGLESIIVDPVWPNTIVDLPGADRPISLFHEMCKAIPRDTERLVVQLGCDSDPRFLKGIPLRWPFLRVCWLDYACPSHKGRLLYTGDVAYAYGCPPISIHGRRLISGMCRSSKLDKLFIRHIKGHSGGSFTGKYDVDENGINNLPHPTPRRLEHVEWLVRQFSDRAVCDPFLGGGTTGVAAKKLGRRFVGIEIEEKYLEFSIKRIIRQPVAIQEELVKVKVKRIRQPMFEAKNV
jgi:hypothetical protein